MLERHSGVERSDPRFLLPVHSSQVGLEQFVGLRFIEAVEADVALRAKAPADLELAAGTRVEVPPSPADGFFDGAVVAHVEILVGVMLPFPPITTDKATVLAEQEA